MGSKILINAVDAEECRIARVKDNTLEDFHFETASREITKGNIYKAVISHVEPSLQAAFIDYGAERHGFLQRHEIHSDYFLDSSSGDRSFQNLVKRGQEILVQVTKDPVMNKGSALTTFISLAGMHVVLMPGSKTRGVSRKIEDEEERKHLKSIVEKLTLPEDYGLIVRTAGKNATQAEIAKDVKYLVRLWENIQKKIRDEKAPVLLYKEKNIAIRSIRDYFTPDVTEILIDNKEIYDEVRQFVKIIAPKQVKIVKLHDSAKPIFTKHQLENQIASIFENRVHLKSGGTIVIEQTEALVTIDVNSGKATQKDNIHQTALTTNLEAAEEIARQLRLRDLGGLIVIDFIDMRDSKHNAKVEHTMKLNLKADKARTKVGRISKFGLMEMSRQRIRPSLESGNFIICGHCSGKGLTPSTESLSLGFLRELRLKTIKGGISTVKGIVPVNVADYLLNRKRNEILDLEIRRGLSITIAGDTSLKPGESNIVCE